VDPLLFPLEQETGHLAIEEIKHFAPAHLAPAGGRVAFENGSLAAWVI